MEKYKVTLTADERYELEQLAQLACSDPPEGRGSWTLQLLADRLVVLGQVGVCLP